MELKFKEISVSLLMNEIPANDLWPTASHPNDEIVDVVSTSAAHHSHFPYRTVIRDPLERKHLRQIPNPPTTTTIIRRGALEEEPKRSKIGIPQGERTGG